MHTTVIYSGKTAHHSFHADRAIQVRPTVEPQTKIIDGVEHYIGTVSIKGKSIAKIYLTNDSRCRLTEK